MNKRQKKNRKWGQGVIFNSLKKNRAWHKANNYVVGTNDELMQD